MAAPGKQLTSVWKLASEVGASGEYKSVYRHASYFIHGGYSGTHVKTDPRGAVIAPVRTPAFIEPQRNASGSLIPRHGVPQLFVNKMIGKDGITTLSSPVLLRLAEMYLNRAEANAKLGNAAAAIADVNIVRQRAGLADTALYTAANLKGRASVLDVVLEERFLELAWEGHRVYDLFRNGRALFRDYSGVHRIATAPGINLAAGTQTIPATHPRVVHFIPEAEIQISPKFIQNQ